MQALEEEKTEVGADRKGNNKKKLQVKRRKKEGRRSEKGEGEQGGLGTTKLEMGLRSYRGGEEIPGVEKHLKRMGVAKKGNN